MGAAHNQMSISVRDVSTSMATPLSHVRVLRGISPSVGKKKGAVKNRA